MASIFKKKFPNDILSKFSNFEFFSMPLSFAVPSIIYFDLKGRTFSGIKLDASKNPFRVKSSTFIAFPRAHLFFFFLIPFQTIFFFFSANFPTQRPFSIVTLLFFLFFSFFLFFFFLSLYNMEKNPIPSFFSLPQREVPF